ncbi:hypothetical protein [Niabella drilacis]|uniref:Uncharacterized protein n=1 Tax=Niabella drilacis (strain DSM 25811 / CCM 8410 / CCUG 62505 / LMG 26954 / E90) TaxID=1285928 RepID=A0A1G6XH97_NIADE|nr:hypothetical protein [Niabella drilacis]SDD77604.1 hypothetical protein SAMN04487894_11378 [Niabella drilacis]
MLPKLFELHFSQLLAEWKTSKYNSYSDVRKKEYHDNLAIIIQKLELEDFSSMTGSELSQRFYIINFVFKSLEFLNHSTTSTIPFELVYVLELALNDWSSSDQYLIVTSLVNELNGFSFDNTLTSADLLYKVIELLYGVTFKQKLIQINLPKTISKDYLANVVLYHELGHFIEKTYVIGRVIYLELLKAMKSGLPPNDERDVIQYFPYLSDPDLVDELEKNYGPGNIFAMHICEYFCDLFASQYIKDCANYYLEYITLNSVKYSSSHPSTVNRIIFINNHLTGKSGYVINEYKRIIKDITGREIENRSKDFSSQNFEKLIPFDVTDPQELHGLFIYGWKVWLDDWKNINSASGIKFSLSSFNVYEVINNLIEKSIGNFIITKEWNSIPK